MGQDSRVRTYSHGLRRSLRHEDVDSRRARGARCVNLPTPGSREPHGRWKWTGQAARGRCEVNRAGVGEGLMLNGEGYVTEATGDNIFIVQRGTLYTPPTHVGILEGITRNSVIDIAQRLGIPFAERVFTPHAVYTCDECFLTGTGAEVVPVVRVDDREIGNGRPGPVTKQIIDAFHELVNSEGVEIGLPVGARIPTP